MVAGALAGIVLSLGTDVLLCAAGTFPALGQPMSDSHFLLATTYLTVYGVVGAYITARLAPARPMLHALVLGSLGLAANTAGAVMTWNKVPPWGPTGIPLRSLPLRFRPPGSAASFA